MISNGVQARQSISQPSRTLPTAIREDERLGLIVLPVTGTLAIDGLLDDDVWRSHAPVGGFVQSEPDEGYPATERTEVWVAFDADNLYVAAYLYESDPDGIVVTDIRKDFRLTNQDVFEVIIDTFGDRRNGYVFATNPGGGRADRQITNEGRAVNTSWDAPWTARTRRVSNGWTLELVIPLNAIRSAKDVTTWGINFSRRIRRKNEVAFWAPIPRAYDLTRLSLAGNLTGMGSVKGGRDLRITPYAAARTVRETGGLAFDETTDIGVDAKYGLTDGLTLDLTVNPDFAQAEIDAQRVNLTQFPQFFPEKREFFLENSGLFYVGDTPRNTRVATSTGLANRDLVLFFSRRMGLAGDGRPIPIDGGLRLTGQEAGFQVGALALRSQSQDAAPENDYAVVRVRHNLFSNSDVGGLFMIRSAVENRGDVNRVYGGDANIRLPGHIDWSSFLVNTDAPGLSGSQYAYQSSLNREGNFLHVKAGLMAVGENFTNDLGFLRRTGIRKWSLDTGVRPRLPSLRKRGLREMHAHVVWNYFTDLDGNEVAKRLHTGLTFFFNNGGFGQIAFNPTTESLTNPFTINAAVPDIAVGKYDWTTYELSYTADPSRVISGSARLTWGGLWTGNQLSVRTTLTVTPSYRFRGSLSLSRTNVDLEVPNGEFVTEIWTARANYSFTTNMFVDAFAQYDANTNRLNANIRLNVIHHPLSNLYIVFNEQRFMTDGGPAPGRSIIVKLTQMLSY